LDAAESLPLTLIFADINGLKLVNDIFGHAVGDELLRMTANILRQSCRAQDILARIGGDEFVILLPETSAADAAAIVDRIRNAFTGVSMDAIPCSAAIGCETRNSLDQPLDSVLANAETLMYREKTLGRKTSHAAMIQSIIEPLHRRSSREKRHSAAVSRLCREIATRLNLPPADIHRLERAGFLHDIGKIVLDERALSGTCRTAEEQEKYRQHPIYGYRILNLFDETVDLAEGVLLSP
jgi:diguanylate cyclase (GGDEF)-like protein